MTNASWGGKSLFGICFHNTVHHQRKSEELQEDRILEPGADTEAIKGLVFMEPRTNIRGMAHNGLQPDFKKAFSQLTFPALR